MAIKKIIWAVDPFVRNQGIVKSAAQCIRALSEDRRIEVEPVFVWPPTRMPDTRQVALLCLAIVLLGPAAAARAQQFEVPIVARSAIVSGTNDYRRQKGLPPLRQSKPASQVAQAYATYLARTGKTGHGADGRNPAKRLHAAGVKFCKFRGENWHRSWTRPKPAPAGAAVAKALGSGRIHRDMSAL